MKSINDASVVGIVYDISETIRAIEQVVIFLKPTNSGCLL